MQKPRPIVNIIFTLHPITNILIAMPHGFVCLKSKACEQPAAGNKKNRFSEINKKAMSGDEPMLQRF
ncbi:hypothetical protein HMPREF2907_00060 [Neisseria sp. HMSC055H02]|nr:hypothetical protein HMPREF2907_00060 [Neisseria sp. HMSC055H02]